jgi:hypothetical protein
LSVFLERSLQIENKIRIEHLKRHVYLNQVKLGAPFAIPFPISDLSFLIMASSVAGLITIESGAVPQTSLLESPKTATPPYLRAGYSDIDIELNHRPNRDQVSAAGDHAPQHEAMSTEQIQTIWNPYKNRFRVLATCLTAFGNGMNDSALGALIASIEK